MDKVKIGILGAGGWGITMALLLDKMGHRVSLWEPVPEVCKSILYKRENIEYFPGFHVPESISVSEDMGEVVGNSDFLAVTVRSEFFRETLKKLKKNYNFQPIVIGTKGLELDTEKRMSEVLAEELGQNAAFAVISGPTIARELAAGMPAAAVIAGKDLIIAEKFQGIFCCETFRTYTSVDVSGVETGGAFKNVLAIGAGILDGLNLGINTKSSYLTRGLSEMIRIGRLMGGSEKTFYGLSGMGDLITTSFSCHSRNRSFGEGLIITGKDQYLEKEKKVIEGLPAVATFRKTGIRKSVELPITESVYRIVCLDESPVEEIKKLMSRRLKEE